MTTNVDPEEVNALRSALAESAGDAVVARDFRRPRRLSKTDLALLERTLCDGILAAEKALSETLGTRCPVRLEALAEASADELFPDEGDGPFAAVRFRAEGQVGWAVWDTISALRAVERVLGSKAELGQVRRFSPIERTLLGSLLAGLADGVLRSLGIEADDLEVATTREALGDWKDAESPDPHRLHVRMQVEAVGEPSAVDCYLPLRAAQRVAAEAEPIRLPGHLGRVDVGVEVRVEGCEVRLGQLLSLEVGDVIPLDAKVGDPVRLCVEGRDYAEASLGVRDGRLACRVERLASEKETT